MNLIKSALTISRKVSLKFILAVSLLMVQLPLMAQDGNVTISDSNPTIRQIFESVESQLGVRFAYNSSKLDISKKVSLAKSSFKLDELLKIALRETDYSHIAKGKYIILQKTPTQAITGVVVDYRSGMPVIGAVVSVNSKPTLKAKTDSLGRFRLKEVPIGNQTLNVVADKFWSNYRTITLEEKRESKVLFRLDCMVESFDDKIIIEPNIAATEESDIVAIKPKEKELPVADVEKVKSKFEQMNLAKIKPTLFEKTRIKDQSPKLAVKTNVAYLLTTTLNAGVEFAVKDNWTIDATIAVNPWDFGGESMSNVFMVQPELRYWPCRSFEGHFFGAHLMYVGYELGRLSKVPTLSDHSIKGSFMGAGVSYGYHFSLGKQWGLELSAGLGVLSSSYKRFSHWDGVKELRGDHNRIYVGPTKLGASLVYVIK